MSDPVLELSFHAGVDEATRDELVEPGQGWPELVNVRQDHRGAASKRLGYVALTNARLSGSRSSGRRLFAHNGAPTVIDGALLDSYAETAALNTTRSRVPECTYRMRGLPTPPGSTLLYDVEHCNGLVAVTYSGPRAAIVDASSATSIRSPESLGSSDGTALVGSFGGRYFVAFTYSNALEIRAWILDTHALATGWTALATVAATATFPLVCSLSDRVAIAYGTSSGTDRVTVKTYNASGLLETRTVNTGSTTPDSYSIDGSIADTLWVAWNEGTAVKAIGLDADALATTLATANTIATTFMGVEELAICAGAIPGTARAWVLEDTSPPSPYELKMVDVATASGTVSPGSVASVYNVHPASRPFSEGGRYYMACYPSAAYAGGETNDQALCIFVDWTENVTYLRPVANIEPGLAVTLLNSCKVPRAGAGRRIYGMQVARSGEVSVEALIVGESRAACTLVELDFASRARWQPVSHAGNTYLSGAVLSVYDGERVTESGFLVSPSKPFLGSGLTGITGTFRYVAIYEDLDAAGNWVVSGVSPTSDPITVTDKSVSLATRALTISSRIAKDTTRVAWYRTAGANGEPPYHRLGVSVNDTVSSTATFVDDVSEATLAERALLYGTGNLPGTNGAGQDRRAPPGLPHLVSYNGMLVGARGESLFCSGQEVYGEATWFSPAFELPITGGGDLTAIAAQDGVICAFKRSSVFTIPGEAPSDNGASGGLGMPRRLAVDVGCIDPCSVVVTSAGVFFQSERGIELLTRSGTVVWVGEKVQNTLAAFPIVSSAVLDDRNGLVRFSLAASESEGRVGGVGRDLIFDLTLGAWQSVDSKSGSGASEASQDAAMVHIGGARRYAWLGSNGTVHHERASSDPAAHLDNGSAWVPMRAVTPWVSIAGRNGEQFIDQVLLLAKRSTAHNIRIAVAFDFADEDANEKVFTHAQIASLTRQWLVREITQTTSQAVRVTLEDLDPRGEDFVEIETGKGATWVALTFNGQPHRGPKRSSGAQRGG